MDPPPPSLTARELAPIQADKHSDVGVAGKRWKGDGGGGGKGDVGGVDGAKGRGE